ncbi:Uncharacterised protein [uncultured archaeon]|nr:Uncharacterised protein [uncultured archaeon]
MNLIPVTDIISTIGFAAALFFTFQIGEDILDRTTRFFLSVSMCSYLFVGISNVLEWAHVTNFPVIYRDYAIIIFIPFFVCFVYSYGNNKLKKRSAADKELQGYETNQIAGPNGGK